MGKIKEHFARHKELYIGIGIGVGVAAVAGLTCAIMKNPESSGKIVNDSTLGIGKTISDSTIKGSQISFGDNSPINVIHQSFTTNPGKSVVDLDTGFAYDSMRKAADTLGLDYQAMSKHMRGLLTDVSGHRFKFLTFE